MPPGGGSLREESETEENDKGGGQRSLQGLWVTSGLAGSGLRASWPAWAFMGHPLGNPVIHRSSKLLTCSLASRGKSETRDWGRGPHGALEFWDSAPGLRILDVVLISVSHRGPGPEVGSQVAGWGGDT